VAAKASRMLAGGARIPDLDCASESIGHWCPNWAKVAANYVYFGRLYFGPEMDFIPHQIGESGLRDALRVAPVTPEAAGSSPVAPVSSCACRSSAVKNEGLLVEAREASAQQHAAAFEQLLHGLRAKGSEPAAESLVRDCPQLLGYREAPLFQSSLRCGDLQMERTAEIGAGERDREREAELVRFN
jgi:hypothetical protein